MRSLDEVVVVGYGTQRKRDVAGSIASVSSKDLSIQSTGNIQNLFQGRLPGVSVTTSGVPGEAPTIRVRGIGTLSNNNPLYVIDGFPTKGDVVSQINPSNIESVQVLKDASSASIYGAQAANGVILITTKQGKEGKAEIDIKLNSGVQLPTNLPKVLNSQQYGEVLWNAMKNAGLTPSHAQYGNGATPIIPDYIVPAGASEGSFDLNNYDQGSNQFMRANKTGTNWAKEVYRPAQTTNLDLGVRGGSSDAKYFLGANYYSQDALLKWAGYDRISLRGNSLFSFSEHVKLGSNMSAMYSKYNGGTSDASAVYNAPLIPVYDVQGNWAGTKANGLGDSVNPVASLYNQKDNYREGFNFLGNLFMEINFLKSFQFKTTVGANLDNRESKSFSPKTYWNKGDKNTLVNSLSVGREKRLETVWNNTLTYSNSFADSHNVNILLGSEALNYRNVYMSAYRTDFAVEDPDYRYLDGGEASKDNSEYGNEYALFSLFSRINYQYKDKYYLSGVLRRDGSSRFGKNHKYGYFPGVSAAWRISEESFMHDQNIVSDLKLRVSYGLNGNQDIGNYAFVSTYGTDIGHSSYPINGDVNSVTQGISKETIGNADIKWETTRQANVGIDASFLNNKLSVVLDLYHKYTSDILQQVAYPATGGVSTPPYVNIGEMQNNGFELNANYRNSANKDFSYDVGLILSAYKNKVKKLASDQFISNSYTRTEVGYPISSFYGYIIDGIFQTQAEVDNHAEQTDKAIGRWIYRDVNNDGVVNDNDRTYIGNPHPDFEYSLNSRLYYKNFDMNLYIQGTYGNDICFASKGSNSGTDFWSDYFNKSTRILDTWTTDNRDASLPEINILNPNNEAGKVSTYLIEDGSYMRVKLLELGYTLPTVAIRKIGLKQLRVYVSAENLLTITRYNNMDPEVKNGDDLSIGVDYVNNMPLARIFSLGASVTF
jgi:TonB-linked SusC/RagA family outer membrane protein